MTERPDASVPEPRPAPDVPGTPDEVSPVGTDPDKRFTPDSLETTMSEQHTPDEPASRPDPSLSTQLGWPDATTPVPTQATRAMPMQAAGTTPQATPFRVEPSTPVPDDVTRPDEGLPHLPPPSYSHDEQDQASAGYPAPTPSGRPTGGPLVTVRQVPRPGTIVLGLLAMLVSAYVLVGDLTDADLSFRLVGPPLVGAFGGVLLLVGLAGVVAGRLRR